MDAAIRQFVTQRARNVCEYCRLPQTAAPFLTFHIEHIYAQQHGDNDSPDNLALACPDCNRYKGPNLTTLTTTSREIVRLFHPRMDRWDEHFEVRGALILGRTEVGIATAELLQMNSSERIQMRAALLESGDY